MTTSKRPEPDLASELRAMGVGVTPAIELFDQLPDVLFWIKDADFRFRWVNKALVLFNGRNSRWDLLGSTDRDFSDESRVNQFYHDDRKALQGDPVVGRVELVVFNHMGRWYSTTKLPLRDQQERIVGTIGIAVPLQHQKADDPGGAPLAIAMNYIGQHYPESLTNRKIAKACGLSLRVFQRQFVEAYHCTPHAYVRQLRVRLSCQALVFTDRLLSAIAEEHGFSDKSHFSRAFRDTMGMTPREYRTRYRR
jgi:AraC-like DNA-binding protein